MSLHAGSVVADFKIDDRAFKAALINAQREIEKAVTKASSASGKSIDSLRAKAQQLEAQLNKSQIGSKAFNQLAISLRNVNKELAKADSITKGGSFSSGMSDLVKSLPLVSLGLAGIATGLAAIAKSAITAGAELEQTKTAFSVYLGGGEQGIAMAEQFVNELNRIADVTPFTNQEIIQTGKLLLSFGQSTEQVKENLQILGDVAAGTGQPIEGLGRILGQVQAKGRLQSEELMQFMERGINLFPELEKVTGKGGLALQKMISSGQVGFETFRQALKGMTTEGGRFFKMMEVQSKTFSGLLSTIEGTTQNFIAVLGEGAAKGLKPLLEDIIQGQKGLTSNAENWASQIERVFTTFSELVITIRRAYQPVVDIAKQLFSGAENVSIMNALMFGFVTAVYAALAPFKLLITSLQYAQKSLSADFIMTEQQAKEMEKLRADISKGLDQDFQMFANAWKRITEEAKKPVGVNIEIHPQVKEKLSSESGDAGKKAGKKAAEEFAREFKLVMKSDAIGFAGPSQSKIGDIGGGAIGSTNAAPQSPMGGNIASAMSAALPPQIQAIKAIIEKVIETISQILSGISQLLSAQFELAMVKINNQLKLLDFFGEIELRKFRERKEEEVKEFERAEDAKIQKLRDAQREKESILDEEWRTQLEFMDEELKAKLAALEQEFQAQLLFLDLEAADAEQRAVLKEIAEEEKRIKEKEIIDAHNEELEIKEQDSNKKKEADKKRSDDEIAKAEELKQKRIAKMKDEAAKAEKQKAKEIANMRWILELHQFNLEKEFRKKQIVLEAAQAAMSAVQSAMSAGLFGMFLLPGFLSLIHSTMATSLAAVNAQLPPLPPAENFATGGLVKGPGTSISDSIPANLSNGEFVMNAESTKANLPALQAMNNGSMMPGVIVNIGSNAFMVMGSIDDRSAGIIGAAVAQEVTRQQANIFHGRFTQ